MLLDFNLTSWKTLRHQQKLLLWMQMGACYCRSDSCFFMCGWTAISSLLMWYHKGETVKAKQPPLFSVTCPNAIFVNFLSLFSSSFRFHPHLCWVKVSFLYPKQRFAVQTQLAEASDQIHLTGCLPRCQQDAGCSCGGLFCTWQLLPQCQFGSALLRQVRKAWNVGRSCQLAQD